MSKSGPESNRGGGLAGAPTSDAELVLAKASVGCWMRIVGARLDGRDAAWLAAVGLHEGERVVVLRRAALGGPIHVRTSSGGEFAVARELALYLDVAPDREAPL